MTASTAKWLAWSGVAALAACVVLVGFDIAHPAVVADGPVEMALLVFGVGLMAGAVLSPLFVRRRRLAERVPAAPAMGPYRDGLAAMPPSVRSEPVDRSRRILLVVAGCVGALAVVPTVAGLLGDDTAPSVAMALWVASGCLATLAVVVGAILLRAI
jgi:hypothetical protein